MKYNYFPHNHVKIWNSLNPDVFLNIENQLRLIYMRALNPTDSIFLIYDHSLLTQNAVNDLEVFCKRHNIIIKEVQKDILPLCTTHEEKLLVSIYQEELSKIKNKQGGNPGVTSDLLRWMSPVYKLGTYSDFDLIVNTQGLDEMVVVERPLLLNLGSIKCFENSGYEAISPNNDIIAVVDSEQALPFIKEIQKTIYKSSIKDTEDDSLFAHYLRMFEMDAKARLEKIGMSNQLRYFLGKNTLYSNLKNLELISKWPNNIKTACELRAHILQITQSKEIFLIKVHPSFNFNYSKTSEYQDFLFQVSVQSCSGPLALGYGMFKRLCVLSNEIDEEIIFFSFHHYGLSKVFKSSNSAPFHATADDLKKYEKQFTLTNDLSWTQKGQSHLLRREDKLQKAAISLQKFFRSFQAKSYYSSLSPNVAEKINEESKEIITTPK